MNAAFQLRHNLRERKDFTPFKRAECPVPIGYFTVFVALVAERHADPRP
jgi:hypothetical protein